MTKWIKRYDNDVGPDDEYFVEWWEVTDGQRTFKCNTSEDADFLISVLEQPEPEILGWATHHDEPMLFPTRKEAVLYCEDDEEPRPLYTSPPKREWQGLTGDERDTIVRMAGDLLDAICLTESKLEEKNT